MEQASVKVPRGRSRTVRLVATDLDGTLLDPAGRVTPRTVKAVAAARAAGVEVVPVTGRPPQALWDLAEAAGLGPLGVCANGAVLVDLEQRVVLEVEPLAGEIALELVELLRRVVPGVRLACDDLQRFSFEEGFFEEPVDWDQELWKVEDIRSVLRGGCIKLIARCPAMSARELVNLLTERVGDVGHVTASGLDWVDLGAAGVSKAYAMERLCDRLAVRLDEVVAVGDNYNDLPLLAWAGTAMAPANAVPEVLAIADRVLPSNRDDGVAQLLEELAAAAVFEGSLGRGAVI